MNPPEMKAPYRDTVTGFTGVATAYTLYVDDPIPNVRLTYLDQHGVPQNEWLSLARLERAEADRSTGFAAAS